jgi:phosphoribosylformylglycinamidine (FGAM) synthase PurS component|tara:strand:- start:673 stop:813 length:141 start_codon:yes stop_codon:yes gene_type:complete
MTLSEYLKTTDYKIQDLQYKKKLELELEKAKEQVERLNLMLKSWDK